MDSFSGRRSFIISSRNWYNLHDHSDMSKIKEYFTPIFFLGVFGACFKWWFSVIDSDDSLYKQVVSTFAFSFLSAVIFYLLGSYFTKEKFTKVFVSLTSFIVVWGLGAWPLISQSRKQNIAQAVQFTPPVEPIKSKPAPPKKLLKQQKNNRPSSPNVNADTINIIKASRGSGLIVDGIVVVNKSGKKVRLVDESENQGTRISSITMTDGINELLRTGKSSGTAVRNIRIQER